MKELQKKPDEAKPETTTDANSQFGHGTPDKDSSSKPIHSNVVDKSRSIARADNAVEQPATLKGPPPSERHAVASPHDLKMFALWNKYEDVAMHFNDLLIRLRTQALGGVAAIATLAAIIERGDIASDLRWGLLTASFFFLTIFWAAVWIIDVQYYNRLLQGAVVALLKIEEITKSNAPLKQITLSTQIEEMFLKNKDEKKQQQSIGGSSKRPVWWFYFSVFFGLLVGLIVSAGGLCGYKINVEGPSMPAIGGIVQDIQTGKPIKGAEVVLSSDQIPAAGTTTRTANDGSFVIKPKRNWGFYVVSLDSVPIPVKLTVQKEGYELEELHFPFRSMDVIRTNNFKEIRLHVFVK